MRRFSKFVSALGESLLGIVILLSVVAIFVMAEWPKGDKAVEWAGVAATLAAVFAALWTAGQSQRIENRRDEARSLVSANFLITYIISIRNRAAVVSRYAAGKQFGLDDLSSPHYPSVVRNSLEVFIKIPEEAFADAWALPPDCAKLCIRTQAFLRLWQSFVDKTSNTLRDMHADEMPRYLEAGQLSLSQLIGVSEAAVRSLEGVLGEKTGELSTAAASIDPLADNTNTPAAGAP